MVDGGKRRATRSGPHAKNGLAIWRLRRRAGVTQQELADFANVGRIHVINLESGLHLPSGPTRDRIVERLGVERSEIMSSDDDEEDSLPADLALALQTLARYVGARA